MSLSKPAWCEKAVTEMEFIHWFKSLTLINPNCSDNIWGTSAHTVTASVSVRWRCWHVTTLYVLGKRCCIDSPLIRVKLMTIEFNTVMSITFIVFRDARPCR